MIVEYKGDSWKDYPDPNFNPEKVDEDNRFNDPRGNRNILQVEKIIYIEDNFLQISVKLYTNESLGIKMTCGIVR